MASYFLRRFLLVIPTFFGITILVFCILQIVPGGPLEQEIMKLKMGLAGEAGGGVGSMAGEVSIPEEALAEMKRFYQLDKPILVRYGIWVWNLLHLDLGHSYTFAEPVWDVIKERFPVSIYFGLIGFLISYTICIPLGVMKAVKAGSKFDVMSSVAVFIGYSTPGWLAGLVLLVLLGGGSFFDVFPLGEFRSPNWYDLSWWDQVLDQLHHTVLPIVAYLVGSFAVLTIVMKNSLMENVGQDYVRTAFAKGLPERRVIFVHALRNSLIPIATGIGHVVSLVFAGSMLIERTFNINGMGLLTYNAIIQRDYPITLGFLAIGAVLGLIGNILSDICYALIDPRIRFK
ncbi:MAG: ABC transporter permease subunit [Calditrichaeota bacterium]|nr:ABC transporter permease subunit [Calditrichota bacterium]